VVKLNTAVIYCGTAVIYNGILILENLCTAVNYHSIFISLAPGANVIKLLTVVIYHHSMVIPSFCVIKLYYIGNYCGMAVIYHSIVTLEKVGLKLLW
jgi:hypothetical protein